MFSVNGGITAANLKSTHDALKSAGLIYADIPLQRWSNLTYLDTALKGLGTL
jgi:hypothetical protein